MVIKIHIVVWAKNKNAQNQARLALPKHWRSREMRTRSRREHHYRIPWKAQENTRKIRNAIPLSSRITDFILAFD